MGNYKLLLLSPYDGLSHRFWREGLMRYLQDHTDYEVTAVILPPRHFSWRQRGNSLGFAFDPALNEEFDLVIATSLTDLSALRGLNRTIARTPAIVYFHENQFVYPESHPERVLERQLTSIYTALSADTVFFNSQFNRDSFLNGARQLLSKMPDAVPAGVIETIEKRSSIVPVAIPEPAPVARTRGRTEQPVRIVWNHRWEHDKGPTLLLEITEGLLEAGVDFSMSLLGQKFRNSPPVFEEIVQRLADAGRLGQCGYIDSRDEYLAQLADHDVVLSTASQEFQGLAILEAIQYGCVPVTPDALVYPEYVPDGLRYSTADEAVKIIAAGPQANISLMAYEWSAVGPVWLETITRMLSHRD